MPFIRNKKTARLDAVARMPVNLVVLNFVEGSLPLLATSVDLAYPPIREDLAMGGYVKEPSRLLVLNLHLVLSCSRLRRHEIC